MNDLNDIAPPSAIASCARTGLGTARRLSIDVGEVDRVVEGLFLARIVDPGQVPMYQQARIDSPEMSLTRAVLADALRSVLRPRASLSAAQRRDLEEDLAWFDSDDDGATFTFVTVCQRLRIDPEWIRRLIRVRRGGASAPHAEAA
jgi:hypothetical protein